MANIVSRAAVMLNGGLRCIEGFGYHEAVNPLVTQLRPGQMWIAEKQGKIPREALQLSAGIEIVSCRPCLNEDNT